MEVVEPRDLSSHENLLVYLVRLGTPPEDAVWLTEALHSKEFAGRKVEVGDDDDQLEAHLEGAAEFVARKLRGRKDRDAALLEVLCELPAFTPTYRHLKAVAEASEFQESIALSLLRFWTAEERRIDFNRAFEGMDIQHRNQHSEAIGRALIQEGRLAPSIVKAARLAVAGNPGLAVLKEPLMGIPEGWREAIKEVHVVGNVITTSVPPKKPSGSLSDLLDEGLRRIRSAADDHHAALAAENLRKELESFAWPASKWGFKERWAEINPKLAPHFAELDRRMERTPKDPHLIRAWWWCAWRTYLNDSTALEESKRRKLIEVAVREFSYLRPHLRKAEREESRRHFEERRDYYLDALHVMGFHGDLWTVLKTFLLAFRALSVPAVSADLRYWSEWPLEERLPVPQPWSWIPSFFADFLHGFFAREQRRDQVVEPLRGEFAKFCLDRLRTKEGTRTKKADARSASPLEMVEESRHWRLCYVRAVRELRVDPEGTGHHVLYWSNKNDPDPEVRKAAGIAYDEMRKGVGMAPGVSPRRALFAAWWWIRQAHLLNLGVNIDEQGAQRTRGKEVRRVKNSERVVKQ